MDKPKTLELSNCFCIIGRRSKWQIQYQSNPLPNKYVRNKNSYIHSFIHPRFVSRNHVARFQSISQIVVVVQSNHAATIYMCASKHRMRRSSGNEMTSDSPSLGAKIIMQFG